jgi:hypothetical protein|tara:strand:- start:375 stop:656 length:282 start_codon:yes stop_codon:yes gene_type:complete
MPLPSPRNPIRIARGLRADLQTNVANLYEGEIVFAQDEDRLLIKENGVLVNLTSGPSAGDSFTINVTNSQNGEALVYNGGEWKNGGNMDGGNF